MLDRDELQAVVAHEMAHIRNLDIRLMTLLAGMVGAIALMSDGMGRMLGRAAVRRGGGAGAAAGQSKGGIRLALVILVLWLLTLVIAPVISRLLAMAVSRKREYLADATGAQFTRNPDGARHALEKLDAGHRAHPGDHAGRRASVHRGSRSDGSRFQGGAAGRCHRLRTRRFNSGSFGSRGWRISRQNWSEPAQDLRCKSSGVEGQANDVIGAAVPRRGALTPHQCHQQILPV